MKSLEELIDEIWPLALSMPAAIETVDLRHACGRRVAETVRSPIQVPPHDNSSMDGYAVKVDDLSLGGNFGVSQRVPAGHMPAPLERGTVARIFTGAPIPEGADAVVMQELAVVEDDGRVRFLDLPKSGEWIRRSGSDLQAGQVLLQKGAVISPFDVGLLASIGLPSVSVYRRPKVGLLITGSELVNPGQALGPGQIYNSNEFVWHSLLAAMGCEIQTSGIVQDTLDATVQALGELSSCDVILSSGGVSVGEEDHVKPAVEILGQLQSWKVSMKPGKPLAFGRILGQRDSGHAWFFGLPGNPVSSAVTFLLIVAPFLKILAGCQQQEADWRNRLTLRPLASPWLRPDQHREEFLRATDQADGILIYPTQNSGVLTSMCATNGLVRVAPGQILDVGHLAPFVSFKDLLQ